MIDRIVACHAGRRIAEHIYRGLARTGSNALRALKCKIIRRVGITPTQKGKAIMKALQIEIADDHCEGEQFAEWLCSQGHDAKMGITTGNCVNGRWTSADVEANETLRQLWDEYCKA